MDAAATFPLPVIAAIRTVTHERYAEQMAMPWRVWCAHWALTIDEARRQRAEREARDERRAWQTMQRRRPVVGQGEDEG